MNRMTSHTQRSEITRNTSLWDNSVYPTYPSNRGNTQLVLATCALLSFGAPGTGGHQVYEFYANRNFGYQYSSISFGQNDRADDDESLNPSNTFADMLENIKSVFNPTMTEFAAVFGKTRQALHKWIKGEVAPADESDVDLIVELNQAADTLKNSNFEISLIGKRRVNDGKTFIQLVAEGRSPVEIVNQLLPILDKEQKQRQMLSERRNGASSAVHESMGQQDFGVPVLDEKV